MVNEGTLGGAMDGMLADCKNALMARFDGGTNIIENPVQEFSLTLGDSGRTASMDVPVRHWKADDEAPLITAIEQRSEESIWLQFSKPVQGASQTESYAIKAENGDLLGVRAAAYDEAGHAVTLTFSAPPPSGEYTLECPGITDLTMEQNRIAEATPFAFEGAAAPPAEAEPDTMPVGFWIFVVILAIAIIAAIAVLATRKRRAAEAAGTPEGSAAGEAPGRGFAEVDQSVPGGGEMQVHFKQTDVPLPKIRLHVTGPSGQGRLAAAVEKGLELDWRKRQQSMGEFLGEVNTRAGEAPVAPLDIKDPAKLQGNPYIQVIRRGRAGDKWLIPKNMRMTIGRAAEQCNIVVDEANVSRVHCTIQYDDKKRVFYLTDQSTNGTLVGGEKIAKGQPRALAPGESFTISTEENMFKVGLE